uniref:Uncharacterized protein n=1 Tax=Triticum urartu TaxID=4572 RepID=A0A8R7VFK9_TRIUA
QREHARNAVSSPFSLSLPGAATPLCRAASLTHGARHRRRRATPPSLTTPDAGGRVSPGFSLNDTSRAPLSQEWTRKRGRRGGGEGEREELGLYYED